MQFNVLCAGVPVGDKTPTVEVSGLWPRLHLFLSFISCFLPVWSLFARWLTIILKPPKKKKKNQLPIVTKQASIRNKTHSSKMARANIISKAAPSRKTRADLKNKVIKQWCSELIYMFHLYIPCKDSADRARGGWGGHPWLVPSVPWVSPILPLPWWNLKKVYHIVNDNLFTSLPSNKAFN